MRTHDFTAYDDPDLQMVTIEGHVKYTFTPGEKAVMYYRDGSGYPGSPPEVEFYDPVVDSIAITLDDVTIQVNLSKFSDMTQVKLGEAAWSLCDEEAEREAVIEEESR